MHPLRLLRCDNFVSSDQLIKARDRRAAATAHCPALRLCHSRECPTKLPSCTHAMLQHICVSIMACFGEVASGLNVMSHVRCRNLGLFLVQRATQVMGVGSWKAGAAGQSLAWQMATVVQRAGARAQIAHDHAYVRFPSCLWSSTMGVGIVRAYSKTQLLACSLVRGLDSSLIVSVLVAVLLLCHASPLFVHLHKGAQDQVFAGDVPKVRLAQSSYMAQSLLLLHKDRIYA